MYICECHTNHQFYNNAKNNIYINNHNINMRMLHSRKTIIINRQIHKLFFKHSTSNNNNNLHTRTCVHVQLQIANRVHVVKGRA